MARWVAGADGCRGAWAAAFLDLDDPARHRAARVPALAAILDAPEAPLALGVDVPIGLPDRVGPGGRSSERAVRPLLGPRRSSVFPVPPRAAVEAADYATAKDLARARSDPPRAFSIQFWNIRGAVLEADRLLRARPELQARVFEAHPELAFRQIAGAPLHLSKKGAERPAALALRRDLLVEAGLPEALVRARPAPGVGADDHLDALAALVVARDIVEGGAMPFPNPPHEVDRHGLPVAIWGPAPRRGTGPGGGA